MKRKEKPKITISVSEKAAKLKERLKANGINFSYHAEQFIFELAKKHKIK